MAQVTIELKNLLKIEHWDLFDFSYPVISAEWKKSFEEKFKNRYYFNEIGMETPDRFQHYLKTKLNEIMPHYIDLYNQLARVPDWLATSSITRELNGTEVMDVTGIEDITNTVTGTTQGNSQVEGIRSDYPDTTGAFNDKPTETTGETRTSTDTNTASTNQDSTTRTDQNKTRAESVTETRRGDVLQFIQNYNRNIKEIDVMILDELKDLFILVY